MAMLITTKHMSKLLENEYDVPLGVTLYADKCGIVELKLEYVAGSVTVDEKDKKLNMPMSIFKCYFKDSRWIVNTIGDLSHTEIDMAVSSVDAALAKEEVCNGN